MPAYYTLLERVTPTAPWGIAFGDHDRQTVADELESLIDHEPARMTRKQIAARWQIVKTDHTQAAIDKKVAELNAKLAQPNG
jgi:hypothetical protein